MISHRLRLCAWALLGAFGMAATPPVQAQTADSGRVIVKLRPADAAELRTLQGAGALRQPLAARVGAALHDTAGPAPDLRLMRADGMSADELARRLASQPDVEFAEPDRRKHLLAQPNDPHLDQQWALLTHEPAAIRANRAWDLSTGQGVIVAVVDNGVLPAHEDLAAAVLPGYDFISSPLIAGDGDGRDADAADPGDYLTADDLRRPEFAACAEEGPTSSSWHGTRVAGLIAATGNNGRGIAGVAWQARILPVRAVGKCGGWDSDILAAMRWAGGLDVPGVPRNPYPAQVINLSFGGPGSCTAAYRSTVAALNARGISIFAATGNDGGRVLEPANCPGVAGVAALDQDGALADYSNKGPETLVAAPGGNCYYDRSVGCDYQLTTTTSRGLQGPGGDAYTTADLAPTYGTSFAAPLASGVAALMLAVHPELQPGALYRRMAEGSASFLGGFGAQTCTPALCGPGMLDARNAVERALRPQARVQLQRAADGRLQLDGSYSTAAAGRSVAHWQWRSHDPDRVQFLTPNAAQSLLQGMGLRVRLALDITDNRGETDTLTFDVNTLTGEGQVVEGNVQAQPRPGDGPGRDDGEDDDGGGGGGGAVDLAATFGLLMLGGIARQARRRRQLSARATSMPPKAP